MADSMVTGRMSEEKKKRALRVLKRNGLNASQAVNLLFDRIIEEGNVDFLVDDADALQEDRWKVAAHFVDGISKKKHSRFDGMSKRDIKLDRLASRGLV